MASLLSLQFSGLLLAVKLLVGNGFFQAVDVVSVGSSFHDKCYIAMFSGSQPCDEQGTPFRVPFGFSN